MTRRRERPGAASESHTNSRLRATERQRGSGHPRPAWPGNARTSAAIHGLRGRGTQEPERPTSACVAGERVVGTRMPEMPEVQAHAERLTESFAGRRLKAFRPLTFTALKTATPPPDQAYGLPLLQVGRRGKFLLVTFEPVTFVVHLMQGGRLLVDTKQSSKPRGGQARFLFEHRADDPPGSDPPALLLTEQGTERRAGVWCLASPAALSTPPLASLGPEADSIDASTLAARFTAMPNTRIHGFLRDQHAVAGIGRRLA